MNTQEEILLKGVKTSLYLKSRKKIFTSLLGEHSSLHSGNGLDFKELREYSSGDDIRHINWNVTAKSLTPAINVYNEDKQLNVVLVYLNSGSIYFGSHKSKQETMIETLAILGYAAANKKDMLSSVFFSSKNIEFIAPSKYKAVVDTNIKKAFALKPLGNDINYNKLNEYLLAKIKKKSVIFIIGDFLEFADFKLLATKHEVSCVVVRDRFEENLKLFGEFNFVNTNNGENENIFLDESSIKKYNELLKDHDNKLFAYFKKLNIRYKKIYTDDNMTLKLKQLVQG
jgi:uncharacterized protein (DUF58 family)